jgi:hypothetical protein
MKTTSYFITIALAISTFLLGAIAVSATPNPYDVQHLSVSGAPGPGASPLAAVGSGFTYQGRLTQGGSPANGTYDFQFTLYDAPSGGNIAGGPLTVSSLTVSNGLFTVQLDFGPSAFQGSARWLEIAVRPTGGSYTTLTPRQPLTAAPYAMSLMPGSTITGTLASSPILSATNTSTATFATALFGNAPAASAIGVKGNGGFAGLYGTSTSNGVYGTASSTTGVGVYGGASGALGYGVRGDGGAYGVVGSGTTAGVSGVSYDPNGYGVQGTVQNGTQNAGVFGQSNATNGAGVKGEADSGTSAYGVWGISALGYGVYGNGGTSGVFGTGGNGLYGIHNGAPEGAGVFGGGGSNGYGIHGVSGTGYAAIWGESSAASGGTGVIGTANGTGVRGNGSAYGVYGVGSATTGYGVYGVGLTGVYGVGGIGGNGVYGNGGANGVSGTGGNGVYGTHTGAAEGAGVYGYGGTNGYGVHGNSATGYAAIWGDSTGPGGVGVLGDANTGTGAIGVFGRSNTSTGVRGYGYHYGVWGYAGDDPGLITVGVVGAQGDYGIEGWGSIYAGVFHGDVVVTGSCCSSEQLQTRIDDPTDPANKYLNQAAVQSSEMKDIYDGVATLDANGEATVMMPSWFQALNKDFRYQLTAIGAPGPNLYIAQEIQGGSASHSGFKIAGGKPGTKVSWQVTGVRNDPYAKDHPTQVEQDKPAGEKGTYLYPQGYGQPESKGVDYERKQQMEQQAQQHAQQPQQQPQQPPTPPAAPGTGK